jgi:hypothetical protein
MIPQSDITEAAEFLSVQGLHLKLCRLHQDSAQNWRGIEAKAMDSELKLFASIRANEYEIAAEKEKQEAEKAR